MDQATLIPHLFRTEYRKMVAVLCKTFGIDYIEIAEDIVSDTFLLASESWSLKGIPENPPAWLYTVAKNKTKDYLKRHTIFQQKIAKQLRHDATPFQEVELDLSPANITDSQLAMIFVVCHPCNPPEAQIGLALNLLCGFGANEIANAFLTNKETIYKRLQRAKDKLRSEQLVIERPPLAAIKARMPSVLMTLYLLFNEGYYSCSNDHALQKDLCLEAIRLAYLLADNEPTASADLYALLALMCFHASRFESRVGPNGQTITYDQQDSSLWNHELIDRGTQFLQAATQGNELSKYQLEAGIAYWHTVDPATNKKWETILQLYNELLVVAYSPIAALNRTFALAKVMGKEAAIREAEKIQLTGHYLYHALLGELYMGINDSTALLHLQQAGKLVTAKADREFIARKISACQHAS